MERLADDWMTSSLATRSSQQQATFCIGKGYKAGCTITSYYTFAGQRVAMRVQSDANTTGVVTWLHSDHLSSASVATDASGNKIANSDSRYLPFGEPRSGFTGSGLPTDRRFTGQISVAGGLIDMNARALDPLLGRFVSADTIIPNPANPQSLNRYSIVFNNPLRYTDPSGHEPCAVYDENGDCYIRYQALPKARIIKTYQGAIIDVEHAQRTNIIAQVRATTRMKGGGTITLNGVLDGNLFEVKYHIDGGLSNEQIVGVALGVLLDFQYKWEDKQGEVSLQHRIGSSYSLEDLPSDYIGFIQEAKGYSLEDIVYHHLGGIAETYDSLGWMVARAKMLFPKNTETYPIDTNPIDLIDPQHLRWPATLRYGPPSRTGWSELSVSYTEIK